jgi:hypothetical protein
MKLLRSAQGEGPLDQLGNYCLAAKTTRLALSTPNAISSSSTAALACQTLIQAHALPAEVEAHERPLISH